MHFVKDVCIAWRCSGREPRNLGLPLCSPYGREPRNLGFAEAHKEFLIVVLLLKYHERTAYL